MKRVIKIIIGGPENYDYSRLDKINEVLPDGMKLMVMGPGGVLENAFNLIGYDNSCYMLLKILLCLKKLLIKLDRDYWNIIKLLWSLKVWG